MHQIKQLTLCLAVAASLALPQTGWGCDMGGNFRCETLEEKIAQSDYVFKAKFVGFGLKPTEDNTPDKSRLGRYKISRIWKGENIKIHDVIVADAAPYAPKCPLGGGYAQPNQSYYFYVHRCKKQCNAHNQFVRKLKCGAIIGLRPNLDKENRLAQESIRDQEINTTIQQGKR